MSQPFWLACASAVRFVRQHGLSRALRLTLTGISTLGLRGVIRRAAADARAREDDERYRGQTGVRPGSDEGQTRVKPGSNQGQTPTISIITAVYNTDPVWLSRCVDSVRAQTYGNWELCICDDGSTRTETIDCVQALSRDLRIRVIRSAANGGIVQASNAALALATGAFAGFLDHDDELAPAALADVVHRLNEDPALDIIYTDEDKIDEAGTHSQPHFKPGWSPELLRSCMYLSHFTVMRRALVHSLGGFRAGTDGAQDYDLALRATEATSRIAHIPKVLYHWRISAASGAGSQLGKPWALEAGRRVLIDDAARNGLDVDILPAEAGGHYRTRRRDAKGPKVTVIVSKPPGLTADQFSARLSAIAARTTYRNLEVIVCTTTINDAVGAAGGEHIVLLDGTTTPEDTGWINALLDACPRAGVGVTSGMVLTSEGLIESAGLVLGADGTPLPAFSGEPSWAHGHRSNLIDVRNCAAVDRVCLLTSRATFERLGGVDEQAWPRAYSIDYSLRARREGLRVAVTPYAQFRRGPDSPREDIPADEENRLRAAWGQAMQQDPYYNPNFDQTTASFRLPNRSLKKPAT